MSALSQMLTGLARANVVRFTVESRHQPSET
jgi:hypothetical protein